MPGGTALFIVGNDEDDVEAALVAGELACPPCGGQLRPWGHARERTARLMGGTERHRPRRGRCRGCLRTTVLLAERFLARRVDSAEVVGEALFARARGAPQSAVASLVGRARETVRNWVAAFSARADALRRHFTSWALALDPRLHEVASHGSGFVDALEALGLAAQAASLALGPKPAWSWASQMTRGGLISTATPNTNWPAPPG